MQSPKIKENPQSRITTWKGQHQLSSSTWSCPLLYSSVLFSVFRVVQPSPFLEISISPEETLYPLVSPPFFNSSPCQPLWSHWSIFCFCGFVDSGHFLQMQPHGTRSFVMAPFTQYLHPCWSMTTCYTPFMGECYPFVCRNHNFYYLPTSKWTSSPFVYYE